MPDPSDAHGLSRPLGSENFTRDAYRTLIEQIDAAIRGINPMTTAQRDALTGAQLWPERAIYNTTASRFERWTGTAWTEDVWASYALRADALHRTLIDAKGDLLVGSGPDAVVRRPVGNAGQFIVSDPAHISGLSFVDHGASGDPHTQYVLESREGVANGIGTLDATGVQPAGQLRTHGADKHADIERHVMRDVTEMQNDGGTMATRGTGQALVRVCELPDGSSNGMHFVMEIPSDYSDGPLAFSAFVTPGSVEGSRNVRLRWNVQQVTAFTLTASGTTAHVTHTVGTVVDGIPEESARVSLSGLQGVAAGALIRVWVGRVGGDGADTFPGVLRLIGTRLYYTATQ